MADKQNLQFIVSAVDKASKVFDDVGKSSDRLGGKLSKVQKAAVGISAATIVAFGASAVRAFAQAETSQLALSDAFERFPKLANGNADALRDLNAELATKTRYDDDATASAQALLAQWDLTQSQLETLTPLLQDYATKTGKDLASAALDLGKALDGSGRALKAIGIDFDDSGTRAGNYTQLVAGLRTQVGGFAEKEGKTAAGQAAILSNQFGELQETVGEALMPAMTGLVEATTAGVKAFGGMPEPVQQGAVAAGILGATALVAVPKIAQMKDAVEQLGGRGKVLTATLRGGVIAAVAALGAASFQAAEDSERLVKAYEDATEAFGDSSTKENLDAYNQSIEDLAARTKDLSDVDGIGDMFGDFSGHVGEFGRTLFGAKTTTEQFRDAADDLADKQSTLNAATSLASKQFGISQAAAEELALTYGIDLERSAWSSAERIGSLYKNQVLAAPATQATSDATKILSSELATAEDRLDAYNTQIESTIGLAQNLAGAEIAAEEALDRMTEGVKENGTTLDINTEKGRTNKSNLLAIIEAADRARDAEAKKTGQIADGNKVYDAYIGRLRTEAREAGYTDAAIEDLIAQYGLLPKTKTTEIKTPGLWLAVQGIERMVAGQRTLAGRITLSTPNGTVRVNPAMAADGGWVPGNGAPRADDVPMLLSSGEFVVNAAAAGRNAALLEAINSGGGYVSPTGSAGGRASGGGPIHVHVHIDEREVANAVVNQRNRGVDV